MRSAWHCPSSTYISRLVGSVIHGDRNLLIVCNLLSKPPVSWSMQVQFTQGRDGLLSSWVH